MSAKIFFGDGFLFQTLTPHEMNIHSLGERVSRFSTRPFPSPSLIEFMAVTKELLAGREPKSSEYSHRFYQNGGLSPEACRVLQRYGDDVILSSERSVPEKLNKPLSGKSATNKADKKA